MIETKAALASGLCPRSKFSMVWQVMPSKRSPALRIIPPPRRFSLITSCKMPVGRIDFYFRVVHRPDVPTFSLRVTFFGMSTGSEVGIPDQKRDGDGQGI